MSRISERLVKALLPAGSLFTALASATPVGAQQVSAGQAPAAWIAYAQTVSDLVQTKLAGDDPVALRLRAYLNQLPGAASADGTALNIAFWIDKKGKITRIRHAPFAQEQPNSDLEALIVGQAMPKAPPKDMLLPLRLSVRIAPAPVPLNAPGSATT